uniref:hypothetical protein n=1 Tax=Vibrio cholerae TaxID=666 RepID=UPI003F58EAF8
MREVLRPSSAGSYKAFTRTCGNQHLPEQFGNPQLIDYLEKLLRTTGLNPNNITFELTESAVMSDSEHTQQMLNAVKETRLHLVD